MSIFQSNLCAISNTNYFVNGALHAYLVGIRGHMGAERHVDVLTELSSR